MDEQEEFKRIVEEVRQQMRAKATTDPEEIERFWAKVKAGIDPNQPPYRLEFLFDPESKLVLLQGNRFGLQSLLNIITRLLYPTSVAGTHAHFDTYTEFSENDLDFIIHKLNDDGSGGAHVVPENRRPLSDNSADE